VIEADVLVVPADLTNFGRPEEMEPLVNILVRLRLSNCCGLGNHDYECGKEIELIRMMTSKVSKCWMYRIREERRRLRRDKASSELGRGVLTAFGEPEIKAFVKASIDESDETRTARMSQLRTPKRVVILHYAPIAGTSMGEAPEIIRYLVVRALRKLWIDAI